MAFGTRIAATVAAVLTVPLTGCGGSDDPQTHATLTDNGCTYRGDKTAAAERFTIEVENQTGHSGHFVLKELANGVTTDSIQPILDNPTPEIVSLFKDVPVFFTDLSADASGVLLADLPAGTYVLMCRSKDPGAPGLQLAAQIEVTRTRSYL